MKKVILCPNPYRDEGLQAAKEAADYITVSNDEDAIAVLIEELDRGKIILGS